MAKDSPFDPELVRELATLYAAFAAGKPSPLEDSPLQYADFAHWQRQWLSGEVLEEQQGYWRERLTHLPVLELPADRPRPEAPSFRGASEAFELTKSISGEVRALSQQAGETDAHGAGRELVGSTLMGALLALLVWCGLSLWPSLWMLTLWLVAAALFCGAGLYGARATRFRPSFWSNALVTLLILLCGVWVMYASDSLFQIASVIIGMFAASAAFYWAQWWWWKPLKQ